MSDPTKRFELFLWSAVVLVVIIAPAILAMNNARMSPLIGGLAVGALVFYYRQKRSARHVRP